MKTRRYHSIMTRMITLYLLFSLIPIILVGYFFNRRNYDLIWNNTAYSTSQMAEQILSSISRRLTDAEYFRDLRKEKAVQSFLISSENYQDVKQILNVFSVYRGNISSNRYINNIYVINKRDQSICDRYGLNRICIKDMERIGQEELLNMSEGKLVTIGNLNPSPKYSRERFVYVGMPLVVPPLLESGGAVILEMKASAFESICSDVHLAETGGFSIVAKDGSVCFGGKLTQDEASSLLSGTKSHAAHEFTDKVKGTKNLIVWRHVPQTDWTLIGHVPISDLMNDAYRFEKTIWLVILVLAFFSVLLYVYYSSRIVLPLRRLRVAMKMAEMGDKNIRYHGKSQDEINDVGESFNSMVVKLDKMAQRDMDRQANLQKMELDLMQAQINPHFLYNTLDAILWQAQIGDTDRVVSTVDALSNFFRTTLSKGSSWISVGEELQMIRNYLIIQKARYGEKLQYDIHVDPSFENLKILKLTLQPIVENAVYHGIKSRPEGGLVEITACEDERYIFFKVSDTGLGMSPEALKTLQREIGQAPDSIYDHTDRGFGLRNVHNRIRLYYGDDCGLEIASTVGKGTAVTVKIRKEVNYV